MARQRLEEDPRAVNMQFLLFNSLFMAGRAEEAFEQGQVLWEMYADAPDSIAFTLLRMSAVAQKTEHVVQFQEYRRLAANALQGQIEAGSENSGRYWSEAILAAIDRRNDDAVVALARAIDLGTRWYWFDSSLIWDALRDDPRFQAQALRMRELIETERMAVVTMLCGETSEFANWEPAPETCAWLEPESPAPGVAPT